MEKFKGAWVLNTEHSFILFNAYTSGIYELEKNDNTNLQKCITPEIESILVNNGIIFENEFNYNCISKYMLNKSVYSTDHLIVTDAVSYNCNLHCVYCMQQNTFKGVNRLSYDKKVDLWEQLLKIYHCKSLQVYLFGGEPFLDIEYIVNMLEYAKAKNLPISSYSAVTNGTILDQNLIDIIKNNNFSTLQITLDGTADVHNSRRTGKIGDNWDKILQNIKTLLAETSVQIIINTVMDINNIDNYISMVETLIKELKKFVFSKEKRIIFKLGMECHPQKKSNYTNMSIPEEIYYNKLYYGLLEQLISKGVYITPILPSGLCIGKKEKDIMISPDGCLYKCITGLGMDRFKVVNYQELVSNPLKLFVNQAKYLENLESSCLDCDYLNLCNGGCRYNAYIEGKTLSCRKNFFDELLPDIIKVQAQVVEVGKGIFVKK